MPYVLRVRGIACNLRKSLPAAVLVAAAIAGCGSSHIAQHPETTTATSPAPDAPLPQGHPQAIQPAAGVQAGASAGDEPRRPMAGRPPPPWGT